MAARVLVVEDAEAIRTAVGIALEEAGCAVLTRGDGDTIEKDLAEFQPDLVLLDVMLPGRDGFALLEIVRQTSNAGIVLLTARDAVEDRLHGLRTGADDYVVKPFVLAELIARVEAVLRRMGRLRTVLEVDDLVIDVEASAVTRAGKPIELTATELKLLTFLAGRRDKVAGKAQILAAVWGYDDYAANLVEVHVSALRRKLGSPQLLHTVRGAGYILRTPEDNSEAEQTL
ncbi:response regulator transcription factor [Kribbella sp. VKM Ac-2568]|uniref:response regulator transcription factor n=1 Tax=Kribbella sp. VKM Ac-2568 TaxID=2512219 RepID=UPI0010511C32|nr:response regulator transcription factor [Kribbella sp. VKM Ac-2568]TCM51458.1 DNA-binding response OmpR family regulator [Kribbella sp. VKM Ac-2568]